MGRVLCAFSVAFMMAYSCSHWEAGAATPKEQAMLKDLRRDPNVCLPANLTDEQLIADAKYVSKSWTHHRAKSVKARIRASYPCGGYLERN